MPQCCPAPWGNSPSVCCHDQREGRWHKIQLGFFSLAIKPGCSSPAWEEAVGAAVANLTWCYGVPPAASFNKLKSVEHFCSSSSSSHCYQGIPTYLLTSQRRLTVKRWNRSHCWHRLTSGSSSQVTLAGGCWKLFSAGSWLRYLQH